MSLNPSTPTSSVPYPRLFVGLSLPPPVTASLQTLVQPNRIPHARWLAPHTWHITLHFLGSAPLPVVQSALESFCFLPFDIQLSSVGVFGSGSRPRVLWAGVAPSAGLNQLHALTGEKLLEKGFALEKRPYNPHVSIAKMKSRDPAKDEIVWTFKEANAPYASPTFTVHNFTLFESVRTHQGITYVSRGDYPAMGYNTLPKAQI